MKQVVEILETVEGSEDGVNVKVFEKGETYKIEQSLCDDFISQGKVKLVEGKKKEAAPENKAKPSAPSNKSKKKKSKK